MIIDCDGCTARPHACSDCVVTVLLGMPAVSQGVELDDAEQVAVGVLAAAGLVPPLRLVERDPELRTSPGAHASVETHNSPEPRTSTGPRTSTEPRSAPLQVAATYDASHGGGAARAG